MYKTYASAPALADPPPELRDYMLTYARKQLSVAGRTEKDVFDLFPFYSILVSSVVNKNLDAFDRIQVFRARHSPEDKPLNYMHDQTKVIGHITHCVAVDEDLKPIPEDTKDADLPFKLHVITSNVIYAISDNVEHQNFVTDLINRICKGKLSVSMECLFRDFDFLLMNSKGEKKLVERNSQTNYLTKLLRQYKGPGKISDYVIARFLKDITFSAVGLVDNPANPDSVISDSLNIFGSSFANVGYISLDQLHGDLTMPETVKADDMGGEPAIADVEKNPLFMNLKDKHDRLAKDHEGLKTRHDDMKAKLDHIHEHTMAKDTEDKEKLEKEVAALKAELASLQVKAEKSEKDKEDMDEACKAAKASVVAMQGENDAMKATLEAYKKAERSEARINALTKIDTSLTREVASKMVVDAGEVSDNAFAVMVNAIANYASKAPKEVTVEKVLSTAVAEVGADTPLGSTTTPATESTKAQIASWFKGETKKTSVKGEK